MGLSQGSVASFPSSFPHITASEVGKEGQWGWGPTVHGTPAVSLPPSQGAEMAYLGTLGFCGASHAVRFATAGTRVREGVSCLLQSLRGTKTISDPEKDIF